MSPKIFHAEVFSRASVFLLSLLAVSCTTLPELTSRPPDNWVTTVESQQAILSWKIQGRLGVQTEDNGGSLDLFWNQKGDDYTIRMIAPMGHGTVLIKGNTEGVSVKTREGEQFSKDAEALMEESLGIRVPIAGLRNWLRGFPMGGKNVNSQSWDEQGRLRELVQDAWNVEMSDYKMIGKHELPHRFYLSRDDRPELGIRLIIKQWQLPGEQARL